MFDAAYTIKRDKVWQCLLCPHNCIIKPGKYGKCNVRKNTGNKIVTEIYNKICALHVDPIEKKPLYHFYPGSKILSIGSIGCNLKCKFCQNWEISQSSCEDYTGLSSVTSKKIIEKAQAEPDNLGIAFTYNEPTIWFEFMFDVAMASHELDMKNVMVTNGFINNEPLSELLEVIDAFSVDLKAFKEDFYKLETLSTLQPVKNAIKRIAKSNKFLEITNLIIPGLNDDEREFSEMIKWIKNECGENTVLHISRYFPRFKMDIDMTPETKLLQFYNMAVEELNYVYLGNINVRKGQNTYCSKCKNEVINRMGYQVDLKGIDPNGNCKFCSTKIIEKI